MWSRWRPSCDWELGHRWAGGALECEWVVWPSSTPHSFLVSQDSGSRDRVGGAWVSLGPGPDLSEAQCASQVGRNLSSFWILNTSSGDLMHSGGWYEMIPSHHFPAADNISSGWASFNSVPVPGAGEVSRRHTQPERPGPPGGATLNLNNCEFLKPGLTISNWLHSSASVEFMKIEILILVGNVSETVGLMTILER